MLYIKSQDVYDYFGINKFSKLKEISTGISYVVVGYSININSEFRIILRSVEVSEYFYFSKEEIIENFILEEI